MIPDFSATNLLQAMVSSASCTLITVACQPYQSRDFESREMWRALYSEYVESRSFGLRGRREDRQERHQHHHHHYHQNINNYHRVRYGRYANHHSLCSFLSRYLFFFSLSYKKFPYLAAFTARLNSFYTLSRSPPPILPRGFVFHGATMSSSFHYKSSRGIAFTVLPTLQAKVQEIYDRNDPGVIEGYSLLDFSFYSIVYMFGFYK